MRYGLTLATLATFLVVGCNQSPPGGNTTNTGNKPNNANNASASGTFTISAPTLTPRSSKTTHRRST